MTTTIYNTAVNAGGVPIRNSTVSVELSYDTEGEPPRVDSSEVMIHRVYSVDTDSNGYWEADVVSNDDIEPTGTLYKITEADVVFYIDVPTAATPTYWVGDLIVTTPAWED